MVGMYTAFLWWNTLSRVLGAAKRNVIVTPPYIYKTFLGSV